MEEQVDKEIEMEMEKKVWIKNRGGYIDRLVWMEMILGMQWLRVKWSRSTEELVVVVVE